jgi:hypothetical protein
MTLQGRNASTTDRFFCCTEDPERGTPAGVDAKKQDPAARRAASELLAAVLKQRGIKAEEFSSSPVAAKVSDIKQCTLDGEADHILSARFLKRLLENDVPWLHADLSASRCEGGLGSVASDVTGFSLGWGLRMLQGKRVLMLWR